MGQPHFSAFTASYNGRANRLITKVRIMKAFDPSNPPNPPYPEFETDALWDTGATGSVITHATALSLGLTPSGMVQVNHAGGCGSSPTYMVNIMLPNMVGQAGVLVTECSDTAGGFGAIIGMDIITRGDFAITNVNNRTQLSFRIPSIKAIDYVIEANKILFSGIGRNDLCPCGKVDISGKRLKFKNCHGIEK